MSSCNVRTVDIYVFFPTSLCGVLTFCSTSAVRLLLLPPSVSINLSLSTCLLQHFSINFRLSGRLGRRLWSAWTPCFAWQARHLVTLCSFWSPWTLSLVTLDAAACFARQARRLVTLCSLHLVTLCIVSGRLRRRLWSDWTLRLLCVAGAALGDSALGDSL